MDMEKVDKDNKINRTELNQNQNGLIIRKLNSANWS